MKGLGQGSCGVVLLYRHRENRECVAVKQFIYNPYETSNESSLEVSD